MKINYKIWVPVAVVLIGGLILAKKKGWIGGNNNAVEVEIGYAHKRMVVETVTASGKIQPEVEVKMSPEVSGEIIEVNVVEGQQVEEGDVLVRINPDIYESAITRARAAVNSAKSALAQSRAALVEAEKLWKRNQILFEKGAISEQEFDAAQRAISVSELQEEASRYQLQSAEANLDEAYKNLKRTTIVAPITGTVSQLDVELGERVVGTATMTGTEMLRIANLNAMEVLVEVNENDIVKVAMGDTTNIEIDAFLGKTFRGVVSEIANSAKLALGASADQVTNFEVKIRVLNESYEGLKAQYGSHPFRPGMTATVDIITNKVKDALVVPIQAVGVRKDTTEKARMIDEAMTDANEKFEVVFLPEGTKAGLKVVKSGIQDDEYIMVSGLKDSTKIITGPYSAVSKNLLKGASIKEKNKRMLLGIETSTKNCSIALFKDGVQLGAQDERGDRFVHGERLHVMIQELLQKHGAIPKDLSGIIVGEGPGSYTGLRIGTSTAKGLAFALNIPMYAVPTLGCFDFSSFESNYCISVLDARRDEVFAQVWQNSSEGFQAQGDIEAVIVNDQSWDHLRGESVTVIGDCAEKMAELLSPLPAHWTIAPTAFPSASAMHTFLGPNLAPVDTAYFEPFYLKDFVAEKSKKKYL